MAPPTIATHPRPLRELTGRGPIPTGAAYGRTGFASPPPGWATTIDERRAGTIGEHMEHSTDPTPDAHDTPTSGPRVSTTDASAVAPPSTNGWTGSDRTVESLEAELADWQRRAVMWRRAHTRSPGARRRADEEPRGSAIGAAAPCDLDAVAVADEHEATVAGSHGTRSGSRGTVVDKVFRRETWTGRP